MTALLKGLLLVIYFGVILCGCRTVSHLPQYEKFIGQESLLDKDYYLYEVEHWLTKGYVLRGEQLPSDPAYGKTTYKFIATLPVRTAVTVIKVQRIYINDGLQNLVLLLQAERSNLNGFQFHRELLIIEGCPQDVQIPRYSVSLVA